MSTPPIFLTAPRFRARAAQMIQNAPDGWVMRLSEPTRSLEQNSLLWPLLTDVAQQVEWYGNKLSPDDWKDMFTASLRKCRAVPGIDGGFVVLGLRTSKMGKREFSDLIELIRAFGSERGVEWSDPT